jgi:hypothetical protein
MLNLARWTAKAAPCLPVSIKLGSGAAMVFILSLVLPFVAALVVAAACSFMWRDILARPTLFFLLSVVVVLGMHRLVQVFLEVGRLLWPGSRSYFLEHQPTPSVIELFERGLTVEAFLLAIVAAAASYPLLLAIRNGVRI